MLPFGSVLLACSQSEQRGNSKKRTPFFFFFFLLQEFRLRLFLSGAARFKAKTGRRRASSLASAVALPQSPALPRLLHVPGLHFPEGLAASCASGTPSSSKLSLQSRLACESKRRWKDAHSPEERAQDEGKAHPIPRWGRNLRSWSRLLREVLQPCAPTSGSLRPAPQAQLSLTPGRAAHSAPATGRVPAGLRSDRREGRSSFPDARSYGETKGSSPRLRLKSHLRTWEATAPGRGSPRKDSTSQRARGLRCLSLGAVCRARGRELKAFSVNLKMEIFPPSDRCPF